MGRKSGRRPRGAEGQGGPSVFFIIALAIGVALLVWGAIVVIRRPVSNPRSLGRLVTSSAIAAS